MNQDQLNSEDKLGRWIKESGHEQPSLDFSAAVLKSLAKEKNKIAYEPVIPPLGFGIIILVIISLSSYVLLFLPRRGANLFMPLEKIQLPRIDFSIFNSFLVSLSSNHILNLSLLAFSIFAFLSLLIKSDRMHRA